MGKPAWRAVFDRVERAIGAPLEDAVSSRGYTDLIVFWINGPLAVNRLMLRLADEQLERVLHLLNMPTREDVARLSGQISTLTAEVRGLSLPADRIESLVSADIQQRRASGDQRAAGGSVSSLPRPNAGGGDGT